MSFVKLYGSILTSSVWAEPAPTRLVWITMLTLADKDGKVEASIPGLAHFARVTLAECETALETFKAPDAYSRTKENEGRRIEEIDGGWIVLNHEKYREMRTEKQIADAERQRKHRDKERDTSQMSHDVATDADGDAEAYTELKAPTPPSAQLEAIAKFFPNYTAALAMLVGMTQGLGTPGMKAVSVEVLTEAATELGVAGGDWTAHRFKRFVEKVQQRGQSPSMPRARSTGYTLTAAKLVMRVRDHENTEHPGKLKPEWQKDFTADEIEIIKAFGIRRFFNEKESDGTLNAQLAKALEETNTQPRSAA